MTCTQCQSNEVTSKITGELCTSCFFKAKGKSNEPQRIELTPPAEVSELSGISEVLDIPRGKFKCSECNELHDEPEVGSNKERKCTVIHQPSLASSAPKSEVKYCQSCIERGFGKVLAVREWNPGYFICQDCFEPLLNNLLSPSDHQMEIIKSTPTIDESKPFLSQFYDVLGIPDSIRFQRVDDALRNRNEIFVHQSNMIANMERAQVLSLLEQLQIMLVTIRVVEEPLQLYINKVKLEEREKNNIAGIQKSKTEVKKPSKIKSSQDQKMADTLFKLTMPSPHKDCACSLCEEMSKKRLVKYQEMQKSAREAEFSKRTGL